GATTGRWSRRTVCEDSTTAVGIAAKAETTGWVKAWVIASSAPLQRAASRALRLAGFEDATGIDLLQQQPLASLTSSGQPQALAQQPSEAVATAVRTVGSSRSIPACRSHVACSR